MQVFWLDCLFDQSHSTISEKWSKYHELWSRKCHCVPTYHCQVEDKIARSEYKKVELSIIKSTDGSGAV